MSSTRRSARVHQTISPLQPDPTGDAADGRGGEDGEEEHGHEPDDDPGENEEAEQPRTLRDPQMPTADEIEKHYTTHLPFRDWCPCCVAAKKPNTAHRKKGDQERVGEEVHMDYCFMKDENDAENVTILVMKDRRSKAVFCDVVLSKGRGQEGTVERALNNLKKLGHKRVTIRTDQEPALVDLANAIITAREEPTTLEHAPVGESQSNGLVERAVRTIEEQIRTFKIALEEKIDRKIPMKHPVMAWIAEHAASCITKYLVGQDGRTAHERLLGKKANEDLVEFGEQVFYRVGKMALRNKAAPRWLEGTWIGKRWGTGEHLIDTETGIKTARGIHRKPIEQRWRPDKIEYIVHAPWNWKNEDEDQDVDDEEPEPLREPHQQDLRPPEPQEQAEPRGPNGVRISKRDLEKWGYTQGCNRCELTRTGKKIPPGARHSPACRKKIVRAMIASDDARVQRALERSEAFKQGIDYRTTRGWRRRPQPQDAPQQAAAGNANAEVRNEPMPKQEGAGPAVDDNMAESDATEDLGDGDELIEEYMDAAGWLTTGGEDNDMVGILMQLGASSDEAKQVVDEVYSPPRVTKAANERPRLGVSGRNAFDITHKDKNGRRWDFSKIADRREARAKIKAEEPDWVIGSPPCTPFSVLNDRWNYPKMCPLEVDRRKAEGRVHLAFCAEIYLDQLRRGAHFLHEHPEGASSWQEPCIDRVRRHHGVQTTVMHMCQYGMKTKVDGIELPVIKPTRMMTSSPQMAKRLARICPRRGGDGHAHCERHGHLLSGRAAAAAIYPPELCIQILKGIRDTALTKNVICGIDIDHNDGENRKEDWSPRHDVYDEMSGKLLPQDLVQQARKEELDFFSKKGVWEIVPIRTAWDKTGRPPISVRWVDVNKGDETNHEIRSRLVAREMSRTKSDEFFAATPPLEAKRMLFSRAATNPQRGRAERKISFVDVRRAYFNAKTSKETYVALPSEAHQEGMCARLKQCMYGTREAGARWEECYTTVLIKIGFEQGKASPCTFRHREREIELVVHGDDLTALGCDESLDWYENALQKEFDVKIRGRLGSGKLDQKEIRILNRIVRWTPRGIEYEADQRHAEIIVRDMGLEKAKGSSVPGQKAKKEERQESRELAPHAATAFRAMAARANYLAQDRPDIAYACKEVCRDMAKPTEASQDKLKKVARYLRDNPRMVYHYPWQGSEPIKIHVDSDWAGCWETRRSTSGGIATIGQHLIKHWSNTQATVALSSGEAELTAIVRGATQGLGLQAIAEDLGTVADLYVLTDSRAGKAMATRKGIGRVRHLAVSELWVQDAIRGGALKLEKVAGEDNTADILTKYVESPLIRKHCTAMCVIPAAGRSDLAPEIGPER